MKNLCWSSCCWAPVRDPGNTGEWICTECGEHTQMEYTQEYWIVVLDFACWQTHIKKLLYESRNHESVEDMVEEFLDSIDTSLTNCEYMISENWFQLNIELN